MRFEKAEFIDLDKAYTLPSGVVRTGKEFLAKDAYANRLYEENQGKLILICSHWDSLDCIVTHSYYGLSQLAWPMFDDKMKYLFSYFKDYNVTNQMPDVECMDDEERKYLFEMTFHYPGSFFQENLMHVSVNHNNYKDNEFKISEDGLKHLI